MHPQGSVLLSVVLLLATLAAGCLGGVPADASDEETPPLIVGGRTSPVAPGSYSVFPGDYRFDGSRSQPVVVGPYEALPVVKHVLRSQLDGAAIDFSLWLPDVPEGVTVPVIIQASPYYSRTDAVAGVGRMMIDDFVPHGYAYVQLAIRSTGDSGGCDDFRGPKMTADMSQAIDWLAGQAWSTGAVGLIGISYVGTTPWYAAGSGNPHVKTIVPISGSTNAWEVYNRNGTPEIRSPIIVATYGATAASNGQRSTEHKVENFTCTEVYEGWATGLASGALADRINHDWWQERNAKPKVEANYEGSVFLIHGLEDWNVDPAVALPWVDELNRTGMPVKQLLGQWPHSYPDSYCSNPGSSFGPTCRWDYAEILLRWFDRWLKELPVDTGPPVQVQDNAMGWRDELTWPPRDTQWETLRLRSDGTLGAEDAGTAAFRLVVQAADMAEFRLGPLEEDLLVAGLPRVHVTVTPDGPGGTIGAFLYDENPATGQQRRIGWTAMNLRFADGGETPQTVVPGQPVVARMEIQPMDAVVPEGHHLLLRLWINTPSDRFVPPPGTPVTVNVGPGVHSVLELPVLDRSPEVYFTPPWPPAASE